MLVCRSPYAARRYYEGPNGESTLDSGPPPPQCTLTPPTLIETESAPGTIDSKTKVLKGMQRRPQAGPLRITGWS